MLEGSSGQGRVDNTKRATWVALRTFRQRPRIVDHSQKGEPIYEVGSARLVFSESGDHFNRLTACSNCGREGVGARVRTQADLSRSGHSVICKDCVRAGSGSSPDGGPAPAEQAQPSAPGASQPAPRGADEERVAALESRLASVLSRLDDLTEAQRSESGRHLAAAEAMRAEMHAALDDVRLPPAVSTEGDPAQVNALEARVSKSFSAVVEFTEGKLGALAIGLAETRSELATAQAETDRRLVEITTWISAQPSPESLLEAFRGERTEVESGLAQSADAQRAELDALTKGLAEARLGIASLEQQLRASEAALTQLVEAQREEARNAVGDQVRQEVASLVRAAEELAQAREVVEGKLDGVVETALDTEVRVNALATSVDAGAGRLQALEQSTRESIDRLTALIDSERRAREEFQARNEQAAAREKRAVAVAPPTPAGPSLLDALDRQLREAEARLAQRVGARDPR